MRYNRRRLYREWQQVYSDCLSVRLSVTLWYYYNKNRSLMIRFSPNFSPDTLVFDDVKTLRKREITLFLQVPSFWNSESS